MAFWSASLDVAVFMKLFQDIVHTGHEEGSFVTESKLVHIVLENTIIGCRGSTFLLLSVIFPSRMADFR